MENKKEKLVLDGNAFYELDLECLKHRKENMQKLSIICKSMKHEADFLTPMVIFVKDMKRIMN